MSTTDAVPSTPPTTRPITAESGVAILVALAASWLAFERLPEGVRDTLWAEDGALFLSDALAKDTGFLEPYAGYLHFVPRAIARAVARFVPVRDFALAINRLACTASGVIAGVVFVCSRDVLTHVAPRIALAMLTVLLPLAGVEVLCTLANLHTLFLWGAFWAVFYRPKNWLESIGMAAFLAAASLTEIQTLLLLPLGLVVLWLNRTRFQLVTFAAMTMGVGAQVWATLTHPRATEEIHLPRVLDFAQIIGLQIGLPLWTTDAEQIHDALTHHGWGLAVLAFLPVFLGVAGTFCFGSWSARVIALCAMGLGFGIFAMSHLLNLDKAMLEPGYSVLDSARILSRYAVGPQLLFMSTLVLALDASRQRKTQPWRALFVVSTSCVAAAAALNLTSDANRRNPASQWQPQLEAAFASCDVQPRPGISTFRISPGRWSLDVPCRRVLRDERRYRAKHTPGSAR